MRIRATPGERGTWVAVRYRYGEEAGGAGCPAPGEGSPKTRVDNLRVATGPLNWLVRKVVGGGRERELT